VGKARRRISSPFSMGAVTSKLVSSVWKEMYAGEDRLRPFIFLCLEDADVSGAPTAAVGADTAAATAASSTSFSDLLAACVLLSKIVLSSSDTPGHWRVRCSLALVGLNFCNVLL